MNALSSQSQESPRHQAARCDHDFNMEGIIANNFGHGDDSEPVDPMRDPRIVGLVSRAKQSA